MSTQLDTCERVLRLVGTDADAEAEVTVTTGTEALTRFATSFIHQNVADAVRAAAPWGVDTARGVETAPGVKDHDLIRAFVRNAKSAA